MSKCFVPGCKTGYKSCKDKCSLFKPPSEPDELEKWRKAVPRADRIRSHKDRVCELHFAPEWVSRSYSVVVGEIICGEVYSLNQLSTLLNSVILEAVPALLDKLSCYVQGSLVEYL